MSEILKSVMKTPRVFKLVYKLMSDDDIISFLDVCPHAIEDIENPTKEMLFTAIKSDSDVLFCMTNPPKEIIRHAIMCDPRVIRRFKRRNWEIPEDLYDYIISENSSMIEHIPNPSDELILSAIKDDWSLIRYVENPSFEIQLIVVTKSHEGRGIEYIRNPDEEIILRAITIDPDNLRYINFEHQTEKVLLHFIDKSERGVAYRFGQMQKPSKTVIWAALKKDIYVSDHLAHIDEDMAKYIVSVKGSQISCLKRQSREVQWLAIKNSPDSIRYVNKPTLEMLRYVLDNFGYQSYIDCHIRLLSQRTILSLVKSYPQLVIRLKNIPYSPRLYKLAEDNIILAYAWYDIFNTTQKVFLKLKFGML